MAYNLGSPREYQNPLSENGEDLLEGSVELLLVLLGAIGAGGDEIDDAKGEGVDAALDEAEDGGDGGGEGGAGEQGVAADDGLEELLVDADEIAEGLADLLLAVLGEGVLEVDVGEHLNVAADVGDDLANVVDGALRRGLSLVVGGAGCEGNVRGSR